MEKKKASLTLSSLAIVLIVAFIAVGIGVFNVNIAILLFLCWMIMWPFAAHLGYSFSEMEGFAYEMAQKCIAPAAIILAVGMMIASFMAAGTVPTILVAGLKLITPKFFLALTFVMCCIMSVIMGTSWGNPWNGRYCDDGCWRWTWRESCNYSRCGSQRRMVW